jgi:tetratricopeptide (TPR) repeat protein
LGLGRLPEALNAYDQAMAHGESARTWVNRGNALSRLERYSEALDAYERALALDSNNVRAWTGKGIALYRMRRLDDFLAAYERVRDLDPLERRLLRLAMRTLARQWRLRALAGVINRHVAAIWRYGWQHPELFPRRSN